MKKRGFRIFSFLLLQLIFAVHFATGQDFNNYKPINSSGQVPQKFLTSSTEKYEEEVKKLSTKEKNRLRKAKKQFFLESSFVIDDMLLSGKVLFNDPVGIYVNKVVDVILKDDIDLRNKLEVYIIKSTQVNAFTTNNGIIFVTLGLVAQVENEAELAYILCHEITHYVKQHNLDEYVENNNINSGRGRYRGTNLDDKLLARSNYSKKQESEADLLGLDRFLKTNYDASTLNGVFNVLEYSHLPFDELAYKKSFIETSNLKFPKNYFLKKTKEIETSGDDDSLATHPAVKLRREAVMNKLKDFETKGKLKFIVSEKDFFTAQKICRFEMSNIFIHYRDYEAAFYNTYLLMQDDPNSFYLKKCIGKALYGLSKYANSDRYDEAHESYSDIQGNSQQVYYFFDKIRKKELNVLAVEYLYNLKKQYPQDKETAAITEDIFSELPMYYEDKSFFSKEVRPTNLDSLISRDTVSVFEETAKKDDGETDDNDGQKSLKRNKYEKINKYTRNKEELKYLQDKSYYIKYAFVDLMKDTAFLKDYDKAVATFNERKKEADYEETPEFKKEQTRTERHDQRKGVALDLKKVVFVNPFYYKVDELKKKNPVKLVASENAQKDFNNQIKNNAALSGLNYQLIDKKELKAGSAELFNDLSALNYYMAESNMHDDMHFVNYMTDELQALPQKYGTKYFDWTGIVSYKRDKSQFVAYNICLGLVMWPYLPIAIYQALKTNYETYIYSDVVDLKTGETIHNFVQKIKFRDRPDVVNSVLYDLYIQYNKSK